MTKPLPSSLKALHIGVVREGRFIEDRWFKSGIDVTFGTGEKNTFAMPLSTLSKRQPLFVHRQGKLMLRFDEQARGKLAVLEGKDLDLAECRKLGLASPKGGCFELPVNEDSRGHITFGDVSFVFNFSKPPPRPPRRVLPREARGSSWSVTDQTFWMVLMISFAFHGCMIATISRRDLPPESVSVADIPDEIIHIQVPKPPDAPKEEEKPLAEEKPKQAVIKKNEAANDSVQHKQDVDKVARHAGLNGLLNDVDGNSGINILFNPSSNSLAEFDKALENNQGLRAANLDPTAKPRGADAGRVTDIGELGGTHDIASAPRLHERPIDIAPSSVTVTDREVEVDSPTLNKDALARFIKSRLASIRACYESQLKRSPSLRGKIVMQFTITSRGTVSEASAAQDSMGSDEVTGCIVRQIKTWRPPFKPDADVTVSFPFVFSPAN